MTILGYIRLGVRVYVTQDWSYCLKIRYCCEIPSIIHLHANLSINADKCIQLMVNSNLNKNISLVIDVINKNSFQVYFLCLCLNVSHDSIFSCTVNYYFYQFLQFGPWIEINSIFYFRSNSRIFTVIKVQTDRQLYQSQKHLLTMVISYKVMGK